VITVAVLGGWTAALVWAPGKVLVLTLAAFISVILWAVSDEVIQ
jgi:hypothetical protein